MKVDKGFYCFGCGEKGDVIHFIEKLYGISPYEAAKKLAEDFHIPIEIGKGKSKRSVKKMSLKKKSPYQLMREFEKWEKYCIRTLSEYLHLLDEWKQQYAPRDFEEEWKEEFVEACKDREQISYYLDILLDGELGDRIEFLRDKGEEVKWIEKRMEEYRRKNNGTDGAGNQEYGIRRCS